MIRALCTRSGLTASASRHTRNVSCSPRATLMMSTCRLSSSTGYPGLILSIATFEDVQGVMHNTPTEQRKYGCPLPCKLPPWEDPRINQKRRESPHATVYPFESEHLSIGHALDTASLGASSRVVMLSGSERAWSSSSRVRSTNVQACAPLLLQTCLSNRHRSMTRRGIGSACRQIGKWLVLACRYM